MVTAVQAQLVVAAYKMGMDPDAVSPLLGITYEQFFAISRDWLRKGDSWNPEASSLRAGFVHEYMDFDEIEETMDLTDKQLDEIIIG